MQEYLLGQRSQPSDLMAWNADVTRMPARMHGEYLRRCYLHNDLAEDRYPVEGRPVSLSDIRQPMFVVGTEKDHVSPWRSVYKVLRLTETALTFVLTSGGHNAGIVSEPGHPRRHYALLACGAEDPWMSPDDWQQAAPRHEGSWWTAWHDWLLAHGSGRQVPARTIAPEAALMPAPGAHVMVRYPD
jgi:polyhydroxyalkanoate synthase